LSHFDLAALDYPSQVLEDKVEEEAEEEEEVMGAEGKEEEEEIKEGGWRGED
jgi:hypothetical protein